MNVDGRPNSNRQWRRTAFSVKAQLRALDTPEHVIRMVIQHMARHENTKRRRYPVAKSGEERQPIPSKIVTFVLDHDDAKGAEQTRARVA